MTKRVGQLFNDWDVSASFWQHRNNPAEYEVQQPNTQANHSTDDTWLILLGILFTIGFLVLLASTTLWNML